MWERAAVCTWGGSVFLERNSSCRDWTEGHTLGSTSSHFPFLAESPLTPLSAGFSTLCSCGREEEGLRLFGAWAQRLGTAKWAQPYWDLLCPGTPALPAEAP